MMYYYLEYYPYFLSGFYLSIYSFTAILLIATTFLKGKYKSESYNLLYVFNTIAAWASIVILLCFIGELFVAWYENNPYEWYAFQSGGPHGTLLSLQWVFIKMHLPFLVGLFFFLRRLRINRLFTILLIILLNSEVILRLLYRFFSLNKDYLPSSWSVNEESFIEKAIKWLLIIIFLILTYVIANKKNKLPYPSVFLK